jgi:desulfoferrodoxin-like iron-binding protein
MSDVPALGGVHRVEDLDTADDFSKKHIPYVSVDNSDGTVSVTVEVGHYVGHPNVPDHWIEYIEIHANGAPIATYVFAAGVVAPRVVAVAALDPGTKIMATARCNLHGLWAAETTV